MKKLFWIFGGLFLASRLFFLANYPHFFDSPEYLRLSLETDFFKSLSYSHESIHPVYLFLTQLFRIFFSFLNLKFQIWQISLTSAVFSILGIASFYLLIRKLFNERVAVFSILPLILFPHLWLIQTNILHESVEQGFFLFGLFVFSLFLEKGKLFFWVLASLSWGLAVFNFIGIILWFPWVFGIFLLFPDKRKSKKDLLPLLLALCLAVFIGTSALYLVLEKISLEPMIHLKNLFLGYGGKGIFSNLSILDILRIARNDFFILLYGYSLAAIFVVFYFVFSYLKQKDYKGMLILFLFFLPFLVSGKFWYGGLFGRYSTLIAYPLSLFLALIPKKKIYFLLMCVLIAFYIPVFWAYQQKPIPEIQAVLIDKIGLEKNDLLILSDYQRPQLEDRYEMAVFLNGDEIKKQDIENLIQKKLNKGENVFISSQAVNFPFYQYDGQQIHIISKGNASKAILADFLVDKKLSLMEMDLKYPQLSLYKLEK
ncbi:MAG: glycosyltransferase family 39 protein [Patescibacteria group bacterium]